MVEQHQSLLTVTSRHAFLDQLNDICSGRKHVSLILFDIIRFSDINTHYGLKQGDDCLIYVVNLLVKLFGDSCVVGRLTNDVLAVVIKSSCNDQQFKNHYHHVREHFKRPVIVNEHAIFIDFNVGASTGNTISVDMNRLVAGAESALRLSKTNQFQNFHAVYLSAKKQPSEYITLKSDLHRALEKSELELYYQPKVNLLSGNVTGAECLLRWHHPEHGLIYPLQLIQATESYNMMNEVGYWVVIQAFKAARLLQQMGQDLVLSINMSPTQLYDVSFSANLARLMRTYDIDSQYIQLELTEDIVLSDSVLVRNQLNSLKSLGFSIAMDDFGKGYSNLSYVRDIELDTIKIDKSFVLGVLDNPVNESIIQAINLIADAMQAHVVAEGIETLAQLQKVQAANVEVGQGFLFSPAVPFDEFSRMCKPEFFLKPVDQAKTMGLFLDSDKIAKK